MAYFVKVFKGENIEIVEGLINAFFAANLTHTLLDVTINAKGNRAVVAYQTV